MKLRTQILLLVFAFALTPLLTAVVINLPLVLERMELFYQKAHLQNLRADFRDLDQHLASRNEMARLLAKLPEPGVVLGNTDADGQDNIDLARTRYIQWMNQILKEQLDIIQIVFLDTQGKEQFWLERDQKSQLWQPTTQRPTLSAESLIQSATKAAPGSVLVSAISLNAEQAKIDPRRFMTLSLVTPVHSPEGTSAIGSVMITIDVGGMARGYRNTLWVQDNGHFLAVPNASQPSGSAFDRYDDLESLFSDEKPVLWKGKQEQIMWVPMFRTDQARSLWVGRLVDPSPIDEFRQALTLRVLSIVFLLALATWLASRWFARRADRISQQLTEGVQHILEDDQAVEFNWHGPEELKHLGRSLSKLAAEHGRKTKDLRNHARELEASNRYKSEFLANISHELKTPLNSILLLSKLLAAKQSGLTPEQSKQAHVIHQAGSDLQSLIDNILDLSRIEARHTPVNLKPIVIDQLLKSVIELVKPQFDAKGLNLQLEITQDLPRQLVSDPDKLRQILKNFLSNAVKFSQQGDIILRLEVDGGKSEADDKIRISVQDSGIGIPADKQKHIFEAFQQADGSTSRRFGGTGLGLTISRQLAQLLDGEITLESEEAKGSTFTLHLPLKPSATPQNDDTRQTTFTAQAIDPPKPKIHEGVLGNHPVLVIDEEVEGLLELIPMLEGWNLQVTAAADTEEALEVLQEQADLRLIVINIRQPGSSCYDTIKQIKATRDVPIIALLTHSSLSAIDCSQETGADDCLQFPLDPQLLFERLSDFLAADASEK